MTTTLHRGKQHRIRGGSRRRGDICPAATGRFTMLLFYFYFDCYVSTSFVVSREGLCCYLKQMRAQPCRQ